MNNFDKKNIQKINDNDGNNTPNTITYHQIWWWEKPLEKRRQCFEENKEMLQKMACDKYRGLHKEEKGKTRKEETREIDIKTCLEKTQKIRKT